MLSDCTQAQFEKLMHNLHEQGINTENIPTQAEYDGALVRQAVAAGWIELDVDNAKPKEVAQLARQIRTYINEVYIVDPN